MRDEIYDRMWVQHHQDFSEAVAGFFTRLGEGYRRLQAIQYAAPWRRAAPPQA
jgi:hypothetical protein